MKRVTGSNNMNLTAIMVLITLFSYSVANAASTSTTVNMTATIQAAACNVNGNAGIAQTVDFGTMDVAAFSWKGKMKVPLIIDCSQTGAAVTSVEVTVAAGTGYWGGNELKLQTSAAKQAINDYSLKLYYEDKSTAVVFSQPHQVTLSQKGSTDASLWAELNQRSTLASTGAWNGAVDVELTYN